MPHETVVNQNYLFIYVLNLGLCYLSNDIKIIKFWFKINEKRGVILKNCAYGR